MVRPQIDCGAAKGLRKPDDGVAGGLYRGRWDRDLRDDGLMMIVAVVVAVVVLPIAAIGLSESWQNRRHRALATRRKDKHRL